MLTTLLTEQTSIDLGINRQAPDPHTTSDRWDWDYKTLANPPQQYTRECSSSLYRGIVPAKNLLNRDLAINGAIVSPSEPYRLSKTDPWSCIVHDEQWLLL